MLDVKQAVETAKHRAMEILGKTAWQLEEIERDLYKGRDVWDITLSFRRDPLPLANPFAQFRPDELDYKRFLIDAESGELVAMKLRELASQ
jgi:hypothetical protein